MDSVELEVLKRTGTEEEKRYAAIIMPVIKNQHLLLVTLLLCNAGATEALPLFLDRLADPFTAVILSVTVVLSFGEVIPQAICSRYGLMVGAYSAWFVRLLMLLTLPLSWPIAKLLDLLLGSDHSALFRRGQLKALVDVHGSTAGFGGTLTQEETLIIKGALDLTQKTAMKSMTPLDKLFMLSTEDRLDERTLHTILLSGHSRIPVFRQSNRLDIVGVILAKELVLIDPSDNKVVRDLNIRELPRLSADTPMYDMLTLFETGKSHMALLVRPKGKDLRAMRRNTTLASQRAAYKRLGSAGTASLSAYHAGLMGTTTSLGEEAKEEAIGIITIEDVIEELLQDEIVDETDMFIDNLQTSRVNASKLTGTLPPRLRAMVDKGAFTPRIGRLGMNQKLRTNWICGPFEDHELLHEEKGSVTPATEINPA
ncbi:hypothetical protein CEUSTIGMA_g6845.t1 [Chlamydomonas eustigma]|uniref:CNNM transmembrane domain-containing protein n=1 Tax=Chlamydomonas eustigma TaxID=1157962 RepID=A0A250X8K3_9CHLO|nr:hypothetical protein CEUSTIGMA_g6845.t1 [Chlamydomonas eustigma]|eukprot:GAX79404.1 hypothetical protein CEUSTIGMA_g6845.t1 [Chlamydomonas eustigma]